MALVNLPPKVLIFWLIKFKRKPWKPSQRWKVWYKKTDIDWQITKFTVLVSLQKTNYNEREYFPKKPFFRRAPLISPQASQAENTCCKRQLVYIESCGMEKTLIIKKNCVNNHLISHKVPLPQICRVLVSSADFKAILTPFSEVIRNRCFFFFLQNGKADHSRASIACQTSFHKLFSPQKEKSWIAIKTTAS